MLKRLYRARREQVLGGVCMGIARYLNVDVTLVRLLWIVFTFIGGSGLVAYIIAWVVIPEEPHEDDVIDVTPGKEHGADTRLIGIIVVAIGLFLLLRQVIPYFFYSRFFWPLIIMLAGLFLIFSGFRRQ
ncbi:MAG TPA: PspC domain-containing protein [Firmicutes bacterium]|nr:PspC domain-containing protein [Bacillota bacterium]